MEGTVVMIKKTYCDEGEIIQVFFLEIELRDQEIVIQIKEDQHHQVADEITLSRS
jgi:hypothetical protein